MNEADKLADALRNRFCAVDLWTGKGDMNCGECDRCKALAAYDSRRAQGEASGVPDSGMRNAAGPVERALREAACTCKLLDRDLGRQCERCEHLERTISARQFVETNYPQAFWPDERQQGEWAEPVAWMHMDNGRAVPCNLEPENRHLVQAFPVYATPQPTMSAERAQGDGDSFSGPCIKDDEMVRVVAHAPDPDGRKHTMWKTAKEIVAAFYNRPVEQQAASKCPKCGADALIECVACSYSTFPQQAARPAGTRAACGWHRKEDGRYGCVRCGVSNDDNVPICEHPESMAALGVDPHAGTRAVTEQAVKIACNNAQGEAAPATQPIVTRFDDGAIDVYWDDGERKSLLHIPVTGDPQFSTRPKTNATTHGAQETKP